MRLVSGPHPESAEASPAGDPAAPPFPPTLDPSDCAGAFGGPLQARRNAATHANAQRAAPRWPCGVVSGAVSGADGRTTDPGSRVVDTAEGYAREGNGGSSTSRTLMR